MLDAEPVRRPEDRPQIAWILHAVEEEAEALGLLRGVGLGEAKDGELWLWLLEPADACPVEALGDELEPLRGCALRQAFEERLELGVAVLGQDEELAGEVPQELLGELGPLGDEAAFGGTSLTLLQRLDALLIGLTQHRSVLP